jgi:hypothetical protein
MWESSSSDSQVSIGILFDKSGLLSKLISYIWFKAKLFRYLTHVFGTNKDWAEVVHVGAKDFRRRNNGCCAEPLKSCWSEILHNFCLILVGAEFRCQISK